MRYLIAVVAWCCGSGVIGQRVLYAVQKSDVRFVSDAPLERIAASSHSASGILDIKTRDFVVRIPMRSFAGFNSPAQSEHFQENYVESRTWPSAPFEGRDLPLDESLDRLEPQLDPEKFFRLNRQVIVHFQSIKELLAYSKSRVKVIMEPPYGEDAVVSSERSAEFKRWLAGS